MRLQLRYPATPETAAEHAALAVAVARAEFDDDLDFSTGSLELADTHIESLRDDGLTAEDAAEALFVLGCYVGEVLRRALGGEWQPTARSLLCHVSPWPMVLVLPTGTAWDPIGKVYKRFELGDSEYLPAYFHAASHGDERHA